MSALSPKADIRQHGWHVRFGSRLDCAMARAFLLRHGKSFFEAAAALRKFKKAY
jgi:hypothetical protein